MRKIVFIFFLLSLSACFALPEEVQIMQPPPITAVEARPFVTVPVSRGNVILYYNPVAELVPTRVERLYFPESGIPVLGIYVVPGDLVEAGDVIAVLSIPRIQSELDSLIRQRERLVLSLTHVNERRMLAAELAAQSGASVNNVPFLEQQRNLQAEIYIIDMWLDLLTIENERRYLRTPMDGTVRQAVSFFYGMHSHSQTAIATIVDQTLTAFVIRSLQAGYLQIGERLNMNLGGGIYLMEVIDPYEYGFIPREEWDVAVFLMGVDIQPTQGFNFGRVHILIEEAEDVLNIPSAALRQAGDRTFVYVYENGLRTVRNVTIGLRGNHNIEIIEGLSEGELIIR